MNQTMDQRRADWAWDQTTETKNKLKGSFGDYKSLADGASATILQTGLGQTVAFYLGQRKDRHDALLTNLASWLCKGGGYDDSNQSNKRTDDGKVLLTEITSEDRDRYHALTDEALEYLIWLKRFAKAVSNDSDQDNNDGDVA